MARKKLPGAILAAALAAGSTAITYTTITYTTIARSDSPASSPEYTATALVSELMQSGPQTVTPRPGMRNVRPIRWQEARPLDNRTVQVVYTSGVEPCYVLDHVTVDYTPASVIITLYQGSDPSAEGKACIMIAVEKATLVSLDEPLQGRPIVDGASALQPSYSG